VALELPSSQSQLSQGITQPLPRLDHLIILLVPCPLVAPLGFAIRQIHCFLGYVLVQQLRAAERLKSSLGLTSPAVEVDRVDHQLRQLLEGVLSQLKPWMEAHLWAAAKVTARQLLMLMLLLWGCPLLGTCCSQVQLPNHHLHQLLTREGAQR
jgi:hypothetical protein